MGKNSIKYLVFMIVLIFSFNVKVNAVPTSQLGEEGGKGAKELSCLYDNSPVADKVLLVQDKSGRITLYKHEKDADWEDAGWYVANAIPRWGDVVLDELDGQLKIYDREPEDDVKMSYLTSCPTSKITLENGGVRFYNDNISYYYSGSYGGKKICLLEDQKDYAFVPQANDYNNSSIDVSEKSCSSFSSDEEMWNVVSVAENYATSCLYAQDVDGGCHIIRLDFTANKVPVWTQAEPLYMEISGLEGNKDKLSIKTGDESVNINSILENFSGICPDNIFVDRNVARVKDQVNGPIQSITTKVYFDNSKNISKYNRKAQKGINQVTGGELTEKVELNFQKIEILDCEALFGGSTDLVDLLKFILNLIKVLVPLLLVGLGALDFAKAVFAGSEDSMKKAQAKFIKRVIIAIAIFLVPSILKLMLGIASGIWGNIDADLCGLL